MGIDVEIGIKLRKGAKVPENKTYVEGEFAKPGEWTDAPFINAQLSSLTRYYGKAYERGPWPQIHALLLELLMHPDVEQVWYWGDGREPQESDFVTLDWLIEMNRHYVAVGHEPYCGRKVR